MKGSKKLFIFSIALVAGMFMLLNTSAFAEPVPGGTLDPLTIPKYEEPLIIPPEMPKAGEILTGENSDVLSDYYEIEVVEFMQQILPSGFPMTKVWSYGSLGRPETRNYPAFTVEAKKDKPTRVKWINNLVDENGNFLPHLLTDTVDQTVHWANPSQQCADGTTRTDCTGFDPTPYTGPVPIITHVHGAHVQPDSDGYPEAWWLPDANNIPAGYATQGTLYDQFDRTNTDPGTAVFQYPNTQLATTLWYHDHTLGMTRLNVYAGPAGFWLIRDPGSENRLKLPGPAPQVGDKSRKTYYEIPIAIQDRSFNEDGSLFYPKDRAFFEGLDPSELLIDFAPDSDVLPIWNPEAFFNTMVVNGRTWPVLEVEPVRYRFRLLNGCNSRFLNLSLFEFANEALRKEHPFYQIGAEGGLLPNVVKIQTGLNTVLPGNGQVPDPVPASHPDQALLMGPAERADVIVDFTGLPGGTIVRMINTAPDAPFGGFPDVPADPDTTGQVMQFVVKSKVKKPKDRSTPPEKLNLPARIDLVPDAPAPRMVSLNEEESQVVCVYVDPITGEPIIPIMQIPGATPPDCGPDGAPFGPTAALLGTVNAGVGVPLLWSDTITERPTLNSTEVWMIFNFTEDAHPIHLHQVQFQVLNRQPMGGMAYDPEPWETGWKDTVIAYPGEITRIVSKFDIPGLYVWHCHIVEHEDNEMMRPFCVEDPATPGSECPGL